jgi:outer membrane protein OmpA-like peptidoglycan-associated protein
MLKLVLIAMLLVATLSCGYTAASDVNFYPINFKPGMPSGRDGFKDSLNASWDTYSRLLMVDASLLISLHSQHRFKVVGFTDDKECRADECVKLSFRRAAYVRQWFLDHGVPSNELDASEGRGMEDPLEKNDTPEGRQTNRRVEINFADH